MKKVENIGKFRKVKKIEIETIVGRERKGEKKREIIFPGNAARK